MCFACKNEKIFTFLKKDKIKVENTKKYKSLNSRSNYNTALNSYRIKNKLSLATFYVVYYPTINRIIRGDNREIIRMARVLKAYLRNQKLALISKKQIIEDLA